jgi:hypothetical protein
MSLTEMLTKIPELTTQERFLLLEALSRALRAELEPHTPSGSAGRLLGIMATDSDLTDEDLDQIRFEQLMERHS